MSRYRRSSHEPGVRGQTDHSPGMRFVAGALLLVFGVLAATWGVAVFGLLTRSPDSDWINGAEYAAPFVLGGSLAVAAGERFLRTSVGAAVGLSRRGETQHRPFVRGRLLLLLATLSFVASPVALVVGLLTPMGDPLPEDLQPDVNPAYPEVYLLLAAGVLLPVIGVAALVVRERCFRRHGFLFRSQDHGG
jgi:hypothetical protein